MCIKCEIKELGASPEVLAKVDSLCNALYGALQVCDELRQEHGRRLFDKEQLEVLQTAQDTLQPPERQARKGQTLAAMLAAFLGDEVEVEVVRVKVDEGDDEAAIDAKVKAAVANAKAQGKKGDLH